MQALKRYWPTLLVILYIVFASTYLIETHLVSDALHHYIYLPLFLTASIVFGLIGQGDAIPLFFYDGQPSSLLGLLFSSLFLLLIVFGMNILALAIKNKDTAKLS